MKSRNTIFRQGLILLWLSIVVTGFMSKNASALPSHYVNNVLSVPDNGPAPIAASDTVPTLKAVLSSVNENALVLVNGESVTFETAAELQVSDIDFVAEYQAKKNVQRFGSEKAKNGVIIIRTKEGEAIDSPLATFSDQEVKLEDDRLVYLLTDKEAQFPGGNRAWTRFITRVCRHNVRDFSLDDFGQCTIRFVIDKDGNVQDVKATKGHYKKMAESIVKAIAQGPKWKPAQLNGENVSSYFVQPVTMRNPLN